MHGFDYFLKLLDKQTTTHLYDMCLTHNFKGCSPYTSTNGIYEDSTLSMNPSSKTYGGDLSDGRQPCFWMPVECCPSPCGNTK